MLLVEQTGGKFAYLFESQKQQATSRCAVLQVFYHPRYVHVMKSLFFMTTFDYLNSLKDFCMLWDIYLVEINRYLANKILGKIVCFDGGERVLPVVQKH